MKVSELIQVNEISFKHAMRAGMVGASLIGSAHADNLPDRHPAPWDIPQQHSSKQYDSPEHHPVEAQKEFTNRIIGRFKIAPQFAQKVVRLAHKYQHETFPKAKDILAIIGAESSFNPNAVSHLQDDPAIGLMQVRPRTWGLNRHDMIDINGNIQKGAEILHNYYTSLHNNKIAAVAAYNVGLDNYRYNREDPKIADALARYIDKFKNEIAQYKGL